jgi:16S rRNA processing protein RimM
VVSFEVDNLSSAKSDLIAIARITKTRGLRGEVVAQPLTGHPERFSNLEAVVVEAAGGAQRTLHLESHWFHQSRLVLKFVGYDTIEQAQQIVGCMIKIPEDERVELEDDEFFHFQLIGCDVVTVSGRPVGRVTDVLSTGGTDLLVVRAATGNERLIPLAASICVAVDVVGKRIQIDPPEGLMEL